MTNKTTVKKVASVGIMVADLMAPIEVMPNKGELARVETVTAHNGGNAMTAALNLGRLGVESCLVGKVGDDIFGKFLIKKLIEGGVSADGSSPEPARSRFCAPVRARESFPPASASLSSGWSRGCGSRRSAPSARWARAKAAPHWRFYWSSDRRALRRG